MVDPTWREAQIDTHREGGRGVEVSRRSVFGATEVLTAIRGDQQIHTSSVECGHLTSRQSIGRLVRRI